MPIFDYECANCGELFEFLHVKTTDSPICPKCQGTNCAKIFASIPHIRMNSEDILKTLPDPQPPLTELKARKGSESGLSDLPRTQLNEYVRRRDKHGNAIWEEKRRSYFGAGGSRRSSAERKD